MLNNFTTLYLFRIIEYINKKIKILKKCQK